MLFPCLKFRVEYCHDFVVTFCQDEARVKQIIIAGKTVSDVVRRAYDISTAKQLLDVGNDLNAQMNVLTALLNKR